MAETTDPNFQKGLEAAIGVAPVEPKTTPTTPAAVTTEPSSPAIPASTPELSDEEKAALAEYEKNLGAPQAKPTEPKITTDGLPDDVKARLSKLDQLESKYEKNPVTKSIAEYIEKGGNIMDLMINRGTDYSKAADDVVVEEYHAYVLGEADKDKLKPEIEKFNKAYPLSVEKKPKVDEFRRILNDRNGITTSQKFTEVIGSKLKEIESQAKPREEERQVIQNKQKDSMTRINDILGKTKDFMGVPIPEDKKQSIAQKAYYHQTFKGSGKDIEFEPEIGINLALLDTLKDEIIKKAKIQGYSDAMKQFKRPSTESSSNSGAAYTGGKTVAERMASGELKIG